MNNFFDEIANFLSEIGITFEKKDTSISNFALFQTPKGNLYLYKLQFFQENETASLEKQAAGSRIIRLYEDVWFQQKAIVKSRLVHFFHLSAAIPARLTQVRRIDKPTADAFLWANHLQGSPSAKYKYGLFLPSRYYRVLKNTDLLDLTATELLVAVATFGSTKKYYRADEIAKSGELIRVASLAHFSVVGGFEKLLKKYIEEVAPDDIMTYVDADWSDGKTYSERGFELIEKISSTEFWANPLTFERIAAKREAMPEGWLKVWNTGSWKVIRKLGGRMEISKKK